MNNDNIHLEIRNPKKQAVDTKLESRACYLTKQRTKEKRNESRGTIGSTIECLGLGFEVVRWPSNVVEMWMVVMAPTWQCGTVVHWCAAGASVQGGIDAAGTSARRW